MYYPVLGAWQGSSVVYEQPRGSNQKPWAHSVSQIKSVPSSGKNKTPGPGNSKGTSGSGRKVPAGTHILQMEKIRPISISTNFQLLKLLCQGCVVLRKGERKTSLDVIPLIHHPIFSPTAVQKLPRKLLLPPQSPLSLVPASVTPEDQILLCLIAEGELDTGSSDSLRKAGPCGRKVFSGALSFFFFLP